MAIVRTTSEKTGSDGSHVAFHAAEADSIAEISRSPGFIQQDCELAALAQHAVCAWNGIAFSHLVSTETRNAESAGP